MPVTTQGMEQALNKLNKIARGEFLKRPKVRYQKRVKGDLKPYPPKLSPDWRRTGELGRKWFASSPSLLRVVFSNTKPYAGWVQGEEGNEEYHQVWWHARTGWKKVDDVSEKYMDKLKSDVVEELRRI
jgi:hypothetical protein